MQVKTLIKRVWAVGTLLIFGLAFRIGISWTGFHWDILSLAYWGEWIYKNGTHNFYTNNVWVYSWPTQPPLVNLVYAFDFWLYITLLEFFRWLSSNVVIYTIPSKLLWWFEFVKWFDNAHYPESYLKIGYFMTIKLVGSVADVIIALILYLIARRNDQKWGLMLSGAYLFSPFSFYISALWGQYDQLSYLFILLAFITISKKWAYVSPFLYITSFSLKPTSLILLPLYAIRFLSAKPKLPVAVFGIMAAIAAFLIPAYFFTKKNFFEFVATDLYSKIFFKADFRLTTNAFNFWHVLVGNKAEQQSWPLLFIPAVFWGLGIFLLLHFISIKLKEQNSQKALFESLFIVGMGGWIFLTTMLDRYAFAGIASGLFVCIWHKNLFKYWVVLSLAYWFNLFYGFWFPVQLKFVQEILTWNEGFATRILSLIITAVYLRMVWMIIKSNGKSGFLKLKT